MAAPASTYDLMLLLDPKADDAAREKIRDDVKAAIEAQGTLVSAQGYGTRKLAFEIRHEGEAEYDLYRFQGPVSLLEHLGRTLRITDGVTRFRIIKDRPGTPPPPDLRQSSTPAEVEGAEAPEPEHAA
jgi:small subunit ribosomal protein S6